VPQSLVFFLACAVLAGGSGRNPGTEPADVMESRMADSDEGLPTSVSDRVEHVGAESEGRIPVSLRRHAQMYFLYRADAGFEDRLRILREALSSQRPVHFTFRKHSGRIVEVEPTEQVDDTYWLLSPSELDILFGRASE
jgi:hypothetical protein